MAKFLTSNELNAAVERLFEKAENELILISPYIKLHERYASALSLKKDKPKLKITVVFGKNEEDLRRSMNIDDLQFFLQFPNIEILYEKRLHAKYFANDDFAIITSMNLHKYSQDTNIEAGIIIGEEIQSLLPSGISKHLGGDLDGQSSEFFQRVTKQAHPIFRRVPQYDDGIFGTRLLKKYIGSVNELDIIADTFKLINNERQTYSKIYQRSATTTTYQHEKDTLTMGKLYLELVATYEFPKKRACPDGIYVYMSDVAREAFAFASSDLKQDNIALKRTTVLTPEYYSSLKARLISEGIPKSAINSPKVQH